ncbi:alpha/beta fold hydrolase [Leifsonia sp. ZF2019]|uniref:alpha/beta fold hydrolase n=1 Tax=Leifsonia sp. ZF2019 TaxID=2781978 RepID=UPI001CBBB2C5|nr:alpha/beta hydrolase [Leifsonia sp. ZF2019]
MPDLPPDSGPEPLADDPRVVTFSHGGATLVAEEAGAGRPVFLLVHGIGMGRKVFDGLVELLARHGRVVAIDQPGYGSAPEPARTLTMERTADLVAAFVRASGLGPVVLIGHSMGTQVATEVAVRHPTLVEQLVLVAPTVDRRARRLAPQLVRMARDLAVENPIVLYKGAREYLRAGPNLRGKLRAMLSHRPELAYPRIAAPTLVLRGADDQVCPPEWCRSVVASIPGAQYSEVPGHRHETMIRDPREAAERILRFVGQFAAGSSTGTAAASAAQEASSRSRSADGDPGSAV